MELSDRLVISKPLYFSEDKQKCGYCRGQKDQDDEFFATESWSKLHENDASTLQFNNCTLGLQVEHMPVEIYDDLCNAGFRRSGNFLYKADMLRNCCRLYTIRTRPEQCKMSKELKSCVSRFRKRIQAANKPRSNGFIDDICKAELDNDSFKTRFEPPVYSAEKYQLFVKYQEQIHQDFGSSVQSFKRFLCESPFPEDVVMGTDEEWAQLNNWRKLTPSDRLKRVGPAHECYFYEGKLIALAVTDFLPSGISSVYFIWDPDFANWSLGKLSALRELSVLSKINREYYYLGYYIDDCPKMKYKCKFGGEILDVCSNQYVPMEVAAPLMQRGKFFVLANKEDDFDDDEYYDEDDDPAEHAQSELPIDERPKFDLSRPTINIVEMIYGEHGGSIESANKAAEKLSELGIEYSPSLSNDIYKPKLEPAFGSTALAEEIYEEEDDGDAPGYLNPIYHLPNVVPGLLPLWQIYHMISSGEMNRLNNKLMLYNTRSGRIRLVYNFDAESKRTKRVICNVIRMIGIRATAKSLIIV
ncbi:LAMI_0D06414g1_1 [Lachancea mirantina]|uniref:arginyltransferase n=1 Tax=Lachancea mirantina TaxID=1230905 RepID=A0A1G4JBQ2_9SACH|nr:LAMI_0D06414g1_1 [Lachancea mirantina]